METPAAQEDAASNLGEVREESQIGARQKRNSRSNLFAQTRGKDKSGLPAVKPPPPAEAAEFLTLIQCPRIGWAATEGLLQTCPSVANAREAVFGWFPLHFAANKGQMRLLKLLLGKRADMNGCCNLMNTPLHIACRGSHEAAVRLLLASTAQLNSKNSNGYTPLMFAAMAGSIGVIEALLSSDVQIHAVDNDGRTAPMWAARHGHEEVLKALLQRGVDLSITDSSGLTVKNHAGHNQQVRNLVSKSEKLMQSLLRAAESDDLAAAEHALSEGAPVDAFDMTGNTSLSIAAMNNSVDMIRLLLRHGADPSVSRAGTSNSFGLGSSQLGDVIKSMFEANEGLLIAARRGDNSGIERALQAGAWPNMQDKRFQRPAVTWTALAGSQQGVLLIAEARADLSLCDCFGKTALHYAVLTGSSSVVSALHHVGANFLARTADGDTSLHLAAMANDPMMVQVLHAADVPCEAKNAEEMTALQVAASRGCTPALSALIAMRADVEARTEEGLSLVALAAINGHESTILALISPVQRPRAGTGDEDQLLLDDDALNLATVDEDGDEDDMSSVLSLLPPGSNRFSSISVSPTSSQKLGRLVPPSPKRGGTSSRASSRTGSTSSKSPDGLGGSKGFETGSRRKKVGGQKVNHGNGAKKRGSAKRKPKEPTAGPNYMFEKASFNNLSMDEEQPPPLPAAAALADRDAHGQTPLLLATRNRHGGIVTLMIKLEAPLDMQDAEGTTALMSAAALGEKSIVFDLLQARANPMLKDKNGWSAVDWATDARTRRQLQQSSDRCAVDLVLPKIDSHSRAADATPSADKVAAMAALQHGGKDASKLAARYRMEGLPVSILPDILERHIRGWLQSIEFPQPADVEVAVEPITMRARGYAYVDFLHTQKVSLLSVPVVQRRVCGHAVSIYKEQEPTYS